jgi:hypothetical protein
MLFKALCCFRDTKWTPVCSDKNSGMQEATHLLDDSQVLLPVPVPVPFVKRNKGYFFKEKCILGLSEVCFIILNFFIIRIRYASISGSAFRSSFASFYRSGTDSLFEFASLSGSISVQDPVRPLSVSVQNPDPHQYRDPDHIYHNSLNAVCHRDFLACEENDDFRVIDWLLLFSPSWDLLRTSQSSRLLTLFIHAFMSSMFIGQTSAKV